VTGWPGSDDGAVAPSAPYFGDDVEPAEAALSPEFVELLERAAAFAARPRRPPIDDEPERICWRAPDGGAA
jgi:hypothetical protein